ncbi:hypothetical protein [Amycolatopsis sp. NPDC059021]
MNDISDDFVDIEDVMARITQEQDAMLAAEARAAREPAPPLSEWARKAG